MWSGVGGRVSSGIFTTTALYSSGIAVGIEAWEDPPILDSSLTLLTDRRNFD